MKNVIIVHGWGGSPNSEWIPWLSEELLKKGFKVNVPEMPNTDEPKIETWIPHLKKIVENPDGKTIFIGHSIGCQTILRYLQKLSENIKVGKVILVAPWMHLDEQTIKEEGQEAVEIAKPWIETPIIWDKIKIHSDKFISIFSDNDPYVPLTDSNLFKKNLNSKIIIKKNMGHFSDDDKIKSLPIVLKEISN